jgi:hypothetical protein
MIINIALTQEKNHYPYKNYCDVWLIYITEIVTTSRYINNWKLEKLKKGEMIMVKRICLSIILVMLLMTSYGGGSVKAGPATEFSGTNLSPGYALITSSKTGNKYSIPIEIQSQAKTVNGGSVTYGAAIPLSVLDGCERLGPTVDQLIIPLAYCEYGDEDSSYSITLSIKLNYSKQTYGGYNHAAAKDYQAKWVRLDPAVTVTAFDMRAYCWGENWINPEVGKCSPNPKYYPASGDKRFSNPLPGTWKKLDPNWDNLWVLLNSAYNHSGKVKATIKRGTTTWTFEVCIGIGGQEFFSCPNCGP